MNLTTAPRRDLVKAIHSLIRQRDTARHAARQYARMLTPEWHAWTAEQCRVHAQAHLDLIGPDPDGRRHLLDLAAEIQEKR